MAAALLLLMTSSSLRRLQRVFEGMEFLKTDRDNTDNTNGGSYNSPRRNKFVKKNVREDENSSDEVREDSRKGKRGAIYEEDSRNGDFRGAEMVDRKEHRDWKNGNRKRSDGSESESSNGDRAAFKPLEFDDDVVGKPRVTRVDMEERIQKLAKCLNGVDVDMPEWKFSEMMRSAQIRFSDHSILRIVQILGKFGNWKRAPSH